MTNDGTPGLGGPPKPGEKPFALPPPRDDWSFIRPQGLQPGTVPDRYPHLGFNPAPGSTDTVRALHAKLIKCAKVLEETRDMITKLLDGSYWKGDAAVAFRQQLEDGPLPLNLKNAAHSIRKAARQLDRWQTELGDFQRRARKLDDRAREARGVLEEAESRAGAAKQEAGAHTSRTGDRPDLSARKPGDDPDSEATLRRLNTAVDDAQAELERILRSARTLAWEHETEAAARADDIRNATDKLAPQEPGFFAKAAAWITENLPDILSIAAGVVALAALTIVTGGTATAILLLAAAALSAGALGTRLADPAVRASIWDGITKGEFDADFFTNTVSVVADGLGMLPGVGAVGKGVVQGVEVVRTGTEALTLGQKFSTVGGRVMTEARAIAGLDNTLLTRAVHAVGGSERVAQGVEVTVMSLSVLSGGVGLLGTDVDALDNEVVEGAGNTIGGLEIAGLGSGELIALGRRVLIR
ncbi:putative T7SS-secreted protein [Streptomyces sp. B22F1]|uniref:putative T7SS-secreted protein n=1 Tax=Streptomyces sp. B22F1 TaxID=3153566 RepID=UPI00325DAF0E